MAHDARQLRQLMDRMLGGCAAARLELVEHLACRVRDLVRRQLRHHVLQEMDTDDVVQQVWMAFFSTDLRAASERSTLNQLLHFLVHHVIWKLVRRENAAKRGKHLVVALERLSATQLQALTDPHPGPPQQVTEQDLVAHLVGQQSGTERDVLLCLFLGYTQEETARRLAVSRRTVARILAACRWGHRAADFL